MNGYVPQSPEVNRSMTPPSVGRRINVVDFSIRQVLMATEGTYRRALNDRATNRPRYVQPVAPITNAVSIEIAPKVKNPSNINHQYPIPNQAPNQASVEGELIDGDRKRMIEEANRSLDEVYGDNNVAS